MVQKRQCAILLAFENDVSTSGIPRGISLVLFWRARLAASEAAFTGPIRMDNPNVIKPVTPPAIEGDDILFRPVNSAAICSEKSGSPDRPWRTLLRGAR